MADIIFECPSCNQRISAAPTFQGTEVQCPSCHQRFVVPHSQNQNPPRDPIPNPTPPAKSAPAESSIRRALQQLRSVLVNGEVIEAWAIQHRFFAITHRRIIIAATSGRLIAFSRGLVSGFEMTDLRWQDLRNAKVRVGIFGATLQLSSSTMSDLASGASTEHSLHCLGLQKDQAQQIYRIAQSHEQAWREKRRIRELEEMRAQSGGIQFAPQPGHPGQSSAQPTDPAARLQQAKQMLDNHLISDSEYESLRARIIAGT